MVREDAVGRRGRSGKVVVTSASPFSRLSSFLAVVPSPTSSSASAGAWTLERPLEQPQEQPQEQPHKGRRQQKEQSSDDPTDVEAVIVGEGDVKPRHGRMSPAPSASTSEASSIGGGITSAPSPFWMSNRNAKSCYECEVSFTLFLRRHHCRVSDSELDL